MQFDYYTPGIVLGIGAHADDIDFNASGSIARWAAEGAEVHYLILTDGSSGSSDASVSAKQLIKDRQTEQRNAASTLGAVDVHFLHYKDGALENTLQLRKDIVRIIRAIRPDTVIVFDPTFVYSSQLGFINHPDHRAAGQATLDAIFPLARDHMSFPELFTDEKLQPHKVSHALLVHLEKANYYIDISDYLEKKFQGLFKHTSQISDQAFIRERFTERAKIAGNTSGYTYAEGFVRIDVPK